MPWPLAEHDADRYRRVYGDYVKTILSSARDEPELTTPQQCDWALAAIDREQAHTIDTLMEGLPTSSELQTEVDRQHHELCAALEDTLSDAQQESARLHSELEAALRELVKYDCPSLRGTFKAAARERKLQTARHKAEAGVLDFSVGVLKPETLIKLRQLLTT